jgi:glyoxylase-like metal-dependent hydrolase (beta-lactamase superfamily II)
VTDSAGKEVGVQQIPPDEERTFLRGGTAPERIEPGLWRIPLPLPFALRSANAYLIAGDGEWVLVDCGLGTPDGEAALRAGLRRAGVDFEHITTLVLTHAHPDHIGLAGPIHAASGAAVRMLGPEAERVYDVWGDSEMRAFRFTDQMYAANGMPLDDLEESVRASRRLRRVIHVPPEGAVDPVEDGDILHLAGRAYRAFWTPGHSDYHLCLLREDGLFIAGDHILPRITPNIGLYPHSRPNPLQDYYESLARVRDLPVRLVLPGHGRQFADLAGRVDELRQHHDERAAHALALLASFPHGTDGYTLAVAFFGDRLRTPDDRRFALAETLAHLEALRADGAVERSEWEGRFTYAATSSVPADR